MPEVPEGYFWRVVPSVLHTDKLQLRKKTWYGSRKVDERLLNYYYTDSRDPIPPVESILWAANLLMKEAEFNDPWPKFYGNYPPKKLSEE
jgi:hypothetical protein